MTEQHGLTSKEASERLQQYGPNAWPQDKKVNPVWAFLRKLWTPIAWILELIIILEFFLGHALEAWIMVVLLLFNSLISLVQEGKARHALRLLSNKLKVRARVLRDGAWQLLPARDLVPGDVIHLRMGDLIPADVRLLQEKLLVDQSTLTGESLPVEVSTGDKAYAGAVVKHGEAPAQVVSTGKQTFFGHTAQIMRTTRTPSHMQHTIFQIIKYLVIFDLLLLIPMCFYALYAGLPLFELVPFALLLLVASVPVALPATYTLATALGSIELAKSNALVVRPSAIEEAAAMTILCVDKTGTLTQNRLEVAAIHAYLPYTTHDLLCLGSIASEEATQDPLDLALLKAAKEHSSPFTNAEKIHFIPFDPEKRFCEALFIHTHQTLRVIKGAPQELLKMVTPPSDAQAVIEKLSTDGSRVLAVIAGAPDQLQLIGFIAFQDPPIADAKQALTELQQLGIRVKMITGDAPATARTVAYKLGMNTQTLPHQKLAEASPQEVLESGIIASAFPEDKFRIIELLQREGHVCGMTGDGVNDAPALKKAEVGIATHNATDVAKAAASLVLTSPGLHSILAAIKISRQIYQRMLTYTLNKIIKTMQIAVLLSLGLILQQTFIISQLLIILLLFSNDFVTMSISTDRVPFSPKPDQWNIKKLTLVGGIFAAFVLLVSFAGFFIATDLLKLSPAQLQTWTFLTLVFTGQAIIYLVRERQAFWHSSPSFWMLTTSILDIVIVSLLALFGLLMAPLPAPLIFSLLLAIILCFFLFDFLKVKLFSLLRV